MHEVYIIFSDKLNKYYIGHCKDFTKRIDRHNKGRVRSTKPGILWTKVYSEQFSTKEEAYKREFQIKSYKSGEAFKKLIKQ